MQQHQPDRPMNIEVVENDDHAVIIPRSYFNAFTGDQIDKVCEALLARGLRYYIVNFGEIEMINTIGISLLVGLIEKVINRQGLVYFTELGGTTREVFEVLNLSTVAMVFPTNDDAIEHMHRDQASMRRAMGE